MSIWNLSLPETICGRRVMSYETNDCSGSEMLIVILDDGTRLLGRISYGRENGVYLADVHTEHGEEIWTEVAVRLLRALRDAAARSAAIAADQRRAKDEERRAYWAEYAAAKPGNDELIRQWADRLMGRRTSATPSA